MKSMLIGAACATALLIAAAAPAEAQRWTTGEPILIGPGSTIGLNIAEVPDAGDSGVREGVVVREVVPDSPASRAGFQPGDIVTEFDGERVRSTRQFQRLVQETPPDREVSAVVLRDGSKMTLEVTPERGGGQTTVVPGAPNLRILPRQAPPAPGSREPFFYFPQVPGFGQPGAAAADGRLGVSAMTLDDQLADYFGVENGVLVSSVEADSPAARAGLRAGDVILRAGTRTVQTPEDVTAAIESAGAGATLELEVMRDRKRVRLQATMPKEEPAQPRGERFRL